MSKFYREKPSVFSSVFLAGAVSMLLVLLLVIFLNGTLCPSVRPGDTALSDGKLSLCRLQTDGDSLEFSVRQPRDLCLFIPNDTGCTLTVNGIPLTREFGQEHLRCRLSDFVQVPADTQDESSQTAIPSDTQAAFRVSLSTPYGDDPGFGKPLLFLGRQHAIDSLILAGSFERFFVIGIAFTILLYSLSLYAGKPSEKYLLLLALLAYSTVARTLWNALPVLKEIPAANLLLLGTVNFPGLDFPADYHLTFLLLKLLITWLRCRLLGEFVSVQIGRRSYFFFCMLAFAAAVPLCLAGYGYYTVNFWLLFTYVLEFYVLARSSGNLLTRIILAVGWGFTVAFRVAALGCTAGVLPHGFLEAAVKPQGIIETFSIIAFVIVINLKFAQKYQEADQLSLSMEEANRNLETIVQNRTQELSEAYNTLSEVQQQKSEFLANTIHNLKTPLFSLYGYTDMALDELTEAPELARRHLLEINKNTSYARELIDNLFLCLRLEDGKVRFNKMPFAVSMLFEQLESTSMPKASSSGIRLAVCPGDAPITLNADLLYLRQALQNIVDNAIRHSPADTEITISAAKEADTVRITIRDQGEGIPADELPLIFNRYYSGGKKGASSSGLGLTISREIIEQHGGTIEAESTPGRGTVFYILLPAGS